jgi:hypothetical protein
MNMRAALLVAVVALLGGCGDDTTSVTTSDLSASGADLAVAADLTQLGCGNILACVAGCGQNFVCQSGCREAGTTAAKSDYDALAGCTAATCAPGDGGTNACTSATDMRPSCLACLANAAAKALNVGAACHNEYILCAGS